MTDASPAFQPDRGSGGFQLAADLGFQTQGPQIVGDAIVVVAGAGTIDGPRVPIFSGGGKGVWLLPRHYAIEGETAVVAAAVGTIQGRRLAPTPRRYQVVGAVTLRLEAAGRITHRDYVRDVLLPEDEEVLVLLLGGT